MSAVVHEPAARRAPHPGRPGIATGAGEAAARRALRAQIARLESEAGAMDPPVRTAAASRAVASGPGRPAASAPRLLTLGELEQARDGLEIALRLERRERDALGARQEDARDLREHALRDPDAHRWVRVSNEDVGDPGCLDWHVRPRFGVLGAFMRWWRVRISSGCP
ncbi:MAG: hypothetical protein QOE06_2669 [Thermoleophilaceae bacterium]|jgi:hypothetical protein|nr:hypothetical protein [Thermoleophilaceae bacterium]